MMIRESVLKLRLTQGRSASPLGDIEIKVPSENNGYPRIVLPGIVQSFTKL